MNLFRRRSSRTSKERPLISFVVIAYDMQREVERTILSLSRDYQRECDDISYEIIVVDNGSPTPLNTSELDPKVPLHLHYIEDASPSPAAAINLGVARSTGQYVAVMIDGARMVSPGVVRSAADAARLAECPVIAVLGLHLGPSHQRRSINRGYSKAVEDELLSSINWPGNGYRLFQISAWGGSCASGWFGTAAESNCIVVERQFFDQLGGYDERFQMAGGGLVNLDFYKRAVEHSSSRLIYLVGEGCFHQLHGGVTTGASDAGHTFEELNEEYTEIRGQPFEAPAVQPLLYGRLNGAHGPAIAMASAELMTRSEEISVEERCAPFLDDSSS